jgi:hypothetical protein
MPAKRRKTGVKKKKLRGGVDPSVGKRTQFKPGQSGNPSGRPKTKPITDAIRTALEQDPKLVTKIAGNAVKQAAKQIAWFKEVRDTIQGKPLQEHSGPDGGPIPMSLEGIDEAILKLIDAVESK